jgi:hypothetical protein
MKLKFIFCIIFALAAAPAQAQKGSIVELRINCVVLSSEDHTLQFQTTDQDRHLVWTPETFIQEHFGSNSIVRGVLPALSEENCAEDGVVIYYQIG